MTSGKFALYFFCWFLWKRAQTTSLKHVRQDSGFVSVKAGDKFTLHCFYEVDDSALIFWYKQTLGQKLKLISRFYVYEKSGTFYDEFKNGHHFTLETGNSKNHLTISNLHISDSATYYCAISYRFVLSFAEGIIVSVRGPDLNNQALIHQSASETIQPGGSVTLNCTVHTGTCDGEHSVYWFRDSGESQPGIIYTNGDNNQCERKPEAQTHTCVYNLPIKKLTHSHVGTYYCAVVSCGHILFGDGTKLDFEDQVDSPVLVYVLSGAVAFTVLLSVLLASLVCKIKKTNCCQCSESQARFTAPSTRNAEGYQDADSIHYAALSVNLPNRSESQRENTKTECVYASVKQ